MTDTPARTLSRRQFVAIPAVAAGAALTGFAEAKANMVITHEPTFWTGNDSVQGFVKDAVFLQKLQFIRDNNIVVWRFHDNLRSRAGKNYSARE